MSARLPMTREEDVKGRVLNNPPILRMSCSLFRLWMMEPAHRNNIALKKACVQMCRKAKCGWLIPTVTIMRPSWLEVEKATIFFRSFCVKAQIAVNSVVIAPSDKVRV